MQFKHGTFIFLYNHYLHKKLDHISITTKYGLNFLNISGSGKKKKTHKRLIFCFKNVDLKKLMAHIPQFENHSYI